MRTPPPRRGRRLGCEVRVGPVAAVATGSVEKLAVRQLIDRIADSTRCGFIQIGRAGGRQMSWWRIGTPVSGPVDSGIRREIQEGEGRLRPPPILLLEATRRATLSPREIEFFELFNWFAVALESSIGESWTVDPVDVTYVRGPDRPVFGRRFLVFYNKVEMGRIEVSPGYDLLNAQEDSVFAWVQLRHLKYVPFIDACNLITRIELYCGPFETQETSSARASGAATAALTGYLWDAMRVDTTAETATLFEHDCTGPYTLFRDSVAHWTKNKVKPEELVKWRYESERDA